MNKHVRKWICLILCLTLIVSLAACAKKPQPSDLSSEPEPESPSSAAQGFVNTLELPTGPYGKVEVPELGELIAEKHAINSDTVGWVQVPGTDIDEVIVCYTAAGDNNNYYYRRNFDKVNLGSNIYSGPTVVYADFRCKFDGTAKGLSNNTVLYGHSFSDDPNDKMKMFAPLNHFKTEEFAKQTPYIYFSTAKEDLVWEIFAVFYATINLPYNRPDLSDTDFSSTVGECVKRSIYTYDTEVSAGDKILTLSTCTYSVPGTPKLPYPNDYRFVVMAKLVTDSAQLKALKTTASLTINNNPKAP